MPMSYRAVSSDAVKDLEILENIAVNNMNVCGLDDPDLIT
jgi:hypothetical protein